MSLTFQTSSVIAILFLLLIIVISLVYKKKHSIKHQINLALQPYSVDKLNAIVLPDGIGGLIDIEQLVLLKQGIVLIETLPMSGNIFGADEIDQWTQMIHGKSFKFTNPLYRIQNLCQAVQTIAPNMPIFCRIIFSADDCHFPKGKPAAVSTLTSLQEDLTMFEQIREITEKQGEGWQEILHIASENSKNRLSA